METSPLPLMRILCPFFTTQPEFVQPFAVLSASTLTARATGFPKDAFLFEPVFGGRFEVVTTDGFEMGVSAGVDGTLADCSSSTTGSETGFCTTLVSSDLTGEVVRSDAMTLVAGERGVSNSIESMSAATKVISRLRAP